MSGSRSIDTGISQGIDMTLTIELPTIDVTRALWLAGAIYLALCYLVIGPWHTRRWWERAQAYKVHYDYNRQSIARQSIAHIKGGYVYPAWLWLSSPLWVLPRMFWKNLLLPILSHSLKPLRFLARCFTRPFCWLLYGQADPVISGDYGEMSTRAYKKKVELRKRDDKRDDLT